MILNENGKLEDSELWLYKGMFTSTYKESAFAYNEMLRLQIASSIKQVNALKKMYIDN